MVKPTFAVITRVPDPDKDSGNLAAPLLYPQRNYATGEPKINPAVTDQLRLGAMLHMGTPVFALGEIVILDSEYGRELTGPQRKPDKWFIDVEHFDNLDDALARAYEVMAYEEQTTEV